MSSKKVRFKDRINKVKTEIVDLEKEIEETRESIDTDMLRTYDRVKKK